MLENAFLKLRARHDIGADEERAIRAAVGAIVRHPADKTVVHAGREVSVSILLLDGMMCRYKDSTDGKRQITALHVPGDFVDLHGFTLKYLDHSIMTLTPCRIAEVPHERLTEITREFPHLTRVFWFATNLDACLHREWTISVGSRSAIARAAHLFCELRVRLEIVGLVDASGYALPLTQIELGECLGLTSVHVNRVLRELRERGLVEFRSGRVTILDQEALEYVADFDPGYLYLERRPAGRRPYSSAAESMMSRR